MDGTTGSSTSRSSSKGRQKQLPNRHPVQVWLLCIVSQIPPNWPLQQVASSVSCNCRVPHQDRLRRHQPQEQQAAGTRPSLRSTRSRRGGQEALLPGLPDDLAIQCLIRVPRAHHGTMRAVCRRWQRLLAGNYFYSLRLKAALAEEWVYVMKRSARDGRVSWHAFDPRYRAWRRLPPVPHEFTDAMGFGCAVLGGCHLYLVGGRDPLKGSMRRVVFYSARTNRWHRAPEMQRRRHFLAAAAVDGRLVVAGGECEAIVSPLPGSAWLRTAEAYDPVRNRWSYLPDMSTAMVPFIGVVYGDNWFLKGVAAGGRQVASEVYIPSVDGWAPPLEGMAAGWRNPSASIGQHLYAVDCPDGCKLRVYDPSTDTWRVSADSGAHLGTSRALQAAALLPLADGKLCIVRNNMSITTVDVADHGRRKGAWETIAGKSQFKTFVTKLWSSFSGGGRVKSHIVHCQVLRA